MKTSKQMKRLINLGYLHPTKRRKRMSPEHRARMMQRMRMGEYYWMTLLSGGLHHKSVRTMRRKGLTTSIRRALLGTREGRY